MGFSKHTQGMAVLAMLVASACATVGEEKREVSKPEKARLLVEVANGALLEGDPTGALENLLRAEQIDASLPEIYHSKALAYYAKHDLNAAIFEAKKAVQLFPTYVEANNTLGKFLIDGGRYEEAEAPLKVAAQNPLNREAYKAYTNLGILFYRKGQYDRSESYLNQAVQAAPGLSCVAYYYRGHIRLRENRAIEAVKDYDSATRKLCARFADAHLALGIAYEQSQQFEKARKKFLEIQERYPNTKLAEQAMTHLRYLP